MVKIKFKVDNYGDEGSLIESVWASLVDGEVYRLENSPFYAYGYSFDDLVLVKENGKDLYVVDIHKHNGHSTYRVFLKEGVGFDKFKKQWTPIESLKCSFEQAKERLFSIDVEHGADLDAVEVLLKKGEDMGIWDYEIGYRYEKK